MTAPSPHSLEILGTCGRLEIYNQPVNAHLMRLISIVNAAYNERVLGELVWVDQDDVVLVFCSVTKREIGH